MNENQEYFDRTEDLTEQTAQAEVAPKKKSGRLGAFLGGMFTGILLTSVVLVVSVIVTLNKSTVSTDTVSQSVANNESADYNDVLMTETAIKKITNIEALINSKFYLERPSNEELQNGMYEGLVDALNDPYSEYYTAEELNEFLEQAEGVYYGIGAYVSLDSETRLPKISGIIENSPAEDSELRPNDLIYEIDGTATYGMTLNDAVKLIKGPEGTDVVLTVIRDGEKDYLYITLTRRQVEAPSVKFKMEDDEIAYIQVTEFNDTTVDQFSNALKQAEDAKAKGIVLDLRANPGGNLSAVVNMCNMILPKGMIVYSENKSGERTEYKSDGKSKFNTPLVVLVDMNSASAAEIMAGAIKDHGVGTLVGTTTFGKGIVQQIIPFADGSAVKLTISAYYLPSGKNIHGIGIEPDVECEFDSEAYYDKENPYDNQLEKAKEVLREKMK